MRRLAFFLVLCAPTLAWAYQPVPGVPGNGNASQYLNGQRQYAVPSGAGSTGNIVGSGSTTVGHAVCWNNTSATAAVDCALIPLGTTGNGSGLTGLVWSQIGSTPTTLAGYGITNGATNGANSNITSLTGLTTPLSVAQGGTGTTTPGLVAGTNVTITGSWPNQTINSTGGGSGLTINSTAITGSSASNALVSDGTKLQQLAYGPTGNSTLVQTTSGGLLTASILPLATTAAFGAVKPDGTTITISAGVISAVGGGTGCTVPGSTSNVLYNSGGSCAANGGFVYDGTSVVSLGVAGTSVGGLKLNNATSGFVELVPVTGALGSSAITIPAATDTMALLAATQTLTNKTINGASNTLTVRLASDISGFGTGVATILGNSPNAANGLVSQAATLTANGLLLGGGSGTAINVLGSLGTTTTVLHGNAAGAPTFGAVAISTDVSGLGTGVATALGNATNGSGGFLTQPGATANLLFKSGGATSAPAASTVSDGGSGVTIGSPTGGAEGAGTLNANGLYDTGNRALTSASTVTASIPIVWDSNTTVANATIPIMLPPWTTAGGTITSVSYYTNGTGTPSFTADVTIGGSGVTGCNAISVSSASPASATCTAANTFTSSSSIALVVSAVSGTPKQAIVQINFTHTPN